MPSVRLTDEQQDAAEIILGECTRSIVRLLQQHLESRRRTVQVRRTLRETAYFQAIALGGLWLRTLEQYEPEAREQIERYARELAALIAREEG